MAFLYYNGFRQLFAILLFVPSLVKSDADDGVRLVSQFTNSLVPKMLQALTPGKENLVVAPFSAATTLGLILEAAPSNVAEETANAMSIKISDIPRLRSGFKTLLTEFKSTLEDEELAGTYLKANLLSSKPLKKSFYDILTTYYNVNVSTNPNANNSSVQILELVSDSGVMSHWKDYSKLAVYTYLSHQASTHFRAPHGRNIEVPMIPQVGVFRYGYVDRLKAEAVELLMETDLMSLLLLKPDLPEGLDELLVKLPKEKFPQLIKSLPLRETEVNLPQFAIVSSDVDLVPFFRQLGIRSIFSNERTRIKSILQNSYFSTSFVAVNSVGSVASVFEFKTKSISRSKRNRDSDKHLVTFDKPFLFFLIHRSSATVLLAGAVQNPTQVPY